MLEPLVTPWSDSVSCPHYARVLKSMVGCCVQETGATRAGDGLTTRDSCSCDPPTMYGTGACLNS